MMSNSQSHLISLKAILSKQIVSPYGSDTCIQNESHDSFPRVELAIVWAQTIWFF